MINVYNYRVENNVINVPHDPADMRELSGIIREISQNNLNSNGTTAITGIKISCVIHVNNVKFFVKVLKENPNITYLDISGTNLVNQNIVNNKLDVLEFLLEALNETNITSLNFSSSNIGHAGIVFIAHLLKNNNIIKNLDISNNDIKDVEAELLAQALEINTCLDTLNISHNNITDTGIEYLRGALEKNMSVGHIITSVGQKPLMFSAWVNDVYQQIKKDIFGDKIIVKEKLNILELVELVAVKRVAQYVKTNCRDQVDELTEKEQQLFDDLRTNELKYKNSSHNKLKAAKETFLKCFKLNGKDVEMITPKIDTVTQKVMELEVMKKLPKPAKEKVSEYLTFSKYFDDFKNQQSQKDKYFDVENQQDQHDIAFDFMGARNTDNDLN